MNCAISGKSRERRFEVPLLQTVGLERPKIEVTPETGPKITINVYSPTPAPYGSVTLPVVPPATQRDLIFGDFGPWESERVEAIRTRGGKIAPSCRFLKPNYFAQFATSEAQRLTASSNASAWLIKRLAITPSNGSCLKAAPSSIARISSAIVSRIQVQFFIFFVSLR